MTPTANNYLLKLIGTNEYHATSNIFHYLHFGNFISATSGSASASIAFNTSSITFTSSYAEGYDAIATAIAEAHQDCFYIRDLISVTEIVPTAFNTVTGMDSSHGAAYFPWEEYDGSVEQYNWVYGVLAAVVWLTGIMLMWAFGLLAK